MRPHLSSTSTYGDADPTLSAGQFEFESRDYAVTRSIRRPRPCFFVTARKALVAHRRNFIDREIQPLERHLPCTAFARDFNRRDPLENITRFHTQLLFLGSHHSLATGSCKPPEQAFISERSVVYTSLPSMSPGTVGRYETVGCLPRIC